MRRACVVFAAMTLSVAVIGCGGSDNTGSSCSPAGTWKTSGNFTSAPQPLCSLVAAALQTQDTMTITVTGNSLTAHAQSGGPDFTGTLDTAKCAAVLNANATQQVPTTDGSTVTLLANSVVNVTFTGNSLSGQQTVAVSTSEPVNGAPCTISGTISGTRQ